MSRTSDRGRPEVSRASWWGRIWQPFWALPGAIAAGSLALGLVLPALDENLGELWWVFQGGVDGARSVLGTIAGAMISVTGLVFSITMVVLQLASSQYSPRVLANFLESRISQVTLGVFTGSFIYALTVLREVGGPDNQVPQLSVTVSYLYVLVAVAMFLAFIHHITVSVEVSTMMSQIREQTIGNVRQLFSGGQDHATWSPRPDTPRADLTAEGRGGYVTELDSTLLVRRAADLGAVVELTLTPGDYVTPGQVVGRVWGRSTVLTSEEVDGILEAIHLGPSRTLHADIGLGIRQLLDIAERALSPGVNDPTTALQAMNEVHAVLRELCARSDLSGYLSDGDGTVRAVYRPQTFARALAATVEELVHYGHDSVRVVPHLRGQLADLVDAALPGHRAVAEQALASVDHFLAEEHRPVLALDVRGKSPGNP